MFQTEASRYFKMDKTEDGLTTVFLSLERVQNSLLDFSKSMRSILSETVICDFAAKSEEMSMIRETFKRDASKYVSEILPKCEDFVRSLSDFFDNYLYLSHADWKVELQNTIKEAERFEKVCFDLIKVHESMLNPIERKKEDVSVLAGQLNKLSISCKVKHSELAKSAQRKRDNAFKLQKNGQLPSVIDLAALHKTSERAFVLKMRQNLDEAAVDHLKNHMIPALQSFLDGLQGIAGYFSILHAELKSIEKRGTAALETDYTETHYKLMRKKGISIKNSCLKFHMILPQVRSDFMVVSDF